MELGLITVADKLCPPETGIENEGSDGAVRSLSCSWPDPGTAVEGPGSTGSLCCSWPAEGSAIEGSAIEGSNESMGILLRPCPEAESAIGGLPDGTNCSGFVVGSSFLVPVANVGKLGGAVLGGNGGLIEDAGVALPAAEGSGAKPLAATNSRGGSKTPG